MSIREKENKKYVKGDILLLKSGQKVEYVRDNCEDEELIYVRFKGYRNKWTSYSETILKSNVKEKISK